MTAPGMAGQAHRNQAIQGLRAACVLAIFAFHISNAGLIPPPQGELLAGILWLCSALRYGVEIFFMISGYVIVQSLRRHGDVGAFLRDRALRIFPLWLPLALAMLAAGSLASLHGGRLPGALTAWPTLLPSLAIMAPVLPVPAIHPGQWSLAYELWFYGFAALAWQLGRRSAWRLVAWALPATVFLILFPRALFFVPGVIVALAEPRLRQHAQWFRHGWLGLPVAWVAWPSSGIDAADASHGLLVVAAEGRLPLAVLAFIGGCAFFAWLLVGRRHASRGLLQHPAMQWLGTISYSFYLVHPLVVAAVKHGLLPQLGIGGWPAAITLAALALPLSCLASWITWDLLEVRLRRWLATGLASGQRARSRRPLRRPDRAA